LSLCYFKTQQVRLVIFNALPSMTLWLTWTTLWLTWTTLWLTWTTLWLTWM